MSPLAPLASKRHADRSNGSEIDSARPELRAALGRVLDLSYRGGPRNRQPMVELFLNVVVSPSHAALFAVGIRAVKIYPLGYEPVICLSFNHMRLLSDLIVFTLVHGTAEWLGLWGSVKYSSGAGQ